MTETDEAVPRIGKGHYSIARAFDQWYIACRSRDLGREPLQRMLYGAPIVLFRGEDGAPAALVDRCAHRNAPLSLGSCEGGQIVCPYHGWTFDAAGLCRRIPALTGAQASKGRRVPCHRVREQQGFVWFYGSPDYASPEDAPLPEPFSFPHLDAEHYATVRYETTCSGTLHANLENILDVPHTAFLHRGLFRGVDRSEITAVVKRFGNRVEAEYVGERAPRGLAGRILAPRGGTVTHFDRFFLPSIAQVEYQLDENHVLLTTALTPTSDFEVTLHSVITFRTVLPRWLLQPILVPLGKRILAQDRVMLKAQLDSVRRFGGEQFVSTDVDVLGPHIWRLLRQAERGECSANHEEVISEESVRLIA